MAGASSEERMTTHDTTNTEGTTRRIRNAAVLAGLGLGVQLVAALHWTPATFILSAVVGAPLVLLGGLSVRDRRLAEHAKQGSGVTAAGPRPAAGDRLQPARIDGRARRRLSSGAADSAPQSERCGFPAARTLLAPLARVLRLLRLPPVHLPAADAGRFHAPRDDVRGSSAAVATTAGRAFAIPGTDCARCHVDEH